MFAADFSISDLERLGPAIESLLDSGKLTENEHWAVDIAGRAATDLVSIRHTEVAAQFYARPDIAERSADTIRSWLQDNPDAAAGTVVSVCGRMHVASHEKNGNLQLTQFLD